MLKVVVCVVALALVAIALQNPQSVEIRIFFFSVMTPKVLLILGVFLAGLVAGAVALSRGRESDENSPVHRALDRSREKDLRASGEENL